MTLPPKGDLAAAEIAFYSPAFLIALFVVIRHGFNRQLGWFYLVVLSIVRIVGSAATLYIDVNNDYSPGLIETASITSAVGTAPLLMALMGFLQRIHQGMERKGLSINIFRPLGLASLVALIIAIVGGVDESHTTNPNDLSTGKDLMEAAAVVFLCVYLALSGIAIWTIDHRRYVRADEKNLMLACAVALPFLLVRIIYTVVSAFSNQGSAFYFRNANVYIQAFMLFLMEAIIICAYFFAGLTTPKMEQMGMLQEVSKDVEGQRFGMGDTAPRQEYGRAADRHHRSAPRQQQQRSIGDYRPSRLIMNAIRDRQ